LTIAMIFLPHSVQVIAQSPLQPDYFPNPDFSGAKSLAAPSTKNIGVPEPHFLYLRHLLLILTAPVWLLLKE